MLPKSLIDQVLLQLYACGNWQLILSHGIALCIMYQAVAPVITHSFVTFAPEGFRCKSSLLVDTSLNDSFGYNNAAKLGREWACGLGSAVGWNDSAWVGNASLGRQSSDCAEGLVFDFRKDTVDSSIVSDFNLVCGREYLTGISYTVFVAGALLADFTVPNLSDRKGRKLTCLICGTALAIVGLAISVATDLRMFIGLKFLYGFFREGVVFTGFVWCVEMMPSSYRTMSGVGMQLYWPVWWLALTLAAYFLRGWRELQLVTAAFHIPCVLVILFIPESIVWLLTNDQTQTFEIAVTQANCVNREQFNFAEHCRKRGLSDESALIVEEDVAEQPVPAVSASADSVGVNRKYTVRDILRSYRCRLWSAMFAFVSFSCFFCYFGISFLAAVTPGNLYVNLVVAGIAEIPSYLAGIYLTGRYGRRRPLIVHQLLTAAILFIAVFVPTTSTSTMVNVIRTVLAIVAKYSVSLVFAVANIYAAEIFPTNIRAVGACMIVSAGNMAQLMVPFVTHVFRLATWLPLAIFAVISLLAAIALFLLPETVSVPLPNTFDDLDRFDAVFCRAKRSKPKDPDDGREVLHEESFC